MSDRPDPTAPLKDISGLKVGDVVQIAVELEDRQRGGTFWWKRFAVVTWLPKFSPSGRARGRFHALSLKMQIDPARDLREIDLSDERQVVTWLPPDTHPQGVRAMWMKALTLGHFRTED